MVNILLMKIAFLLQNSPRGFRCFEKLRNLREDNCLKTFQLEIHWQLVYETGLEDYKSNTWVFGLVQNQSVFRTMSNIYDRALRKKC